MALAFNLQRVNKADIESARAETSSRYTGPTPPPDEYQVAVKKIYAVEQSNGPALNVLFEISGEEGERAVYNGAGIWNRFSIPTDPSYQYFGIQVNSIDNFLRAISSGKFGFDDFVEASNGNRIQTGEDKGKAGQEITQIGRLKLPPTAKIKIKTKMNTYQGRENAALHYVLDAPAGAAGDVDDVDDDVDGLDTAADGGDDLDDLLGDLDD